MLRFKCMLSKAQLQPVCTLTNATCQAEFLCPDGSFAFFGLYNMLWAFGHYDIYTVGRWFSSLVEVSFKVSWDLRIAVHFVCVWGVIWLFNPVENIAHVVRCCHLALCLEHAPPKALAFAEAKGPARSLLLPRKKTIGQPQNNSVQFLRRGKQCFANTL